LVRTPIFTCALLAGLALAGSASAQIYDNEVTVNPAGTGSHVLLYPDGHHGRVVGALLQPGEADPNAPIHLHMPLPHRHVVHRIAKAKPKTDSVVAAKPAPQEQQAPVEDALSFGPVPGESAASMVAPEPRKTTPKPVVAKATPPKKVVAVVQKPVTPPPPKPVVQKSKPAPVKAAAAAPTSTDSGMGFLSGDQMGAAIATSPPPKPATKTASLEPADSKNMSKRSSIPFAPGAEEPAPEVLDTVKTVSGDLNTALGNASARIELEAFGGKPNDRSSEARRLSLKRALIVRQLLIDEGVPSDRIDVRAMGGANDGSPDRVDIFLRA
jgi:outer membrane protein OmpA-like peptidoglycan-associated protein